MSTENWKPVVRYEDLYEVSSNGRIRSLDRLRRNGRFFRGRLLSTRGGKVDGRPRVCLSDDDGERKMYLLYRLILEAFVGPCPEGHEARHHPDRDPQNCRLENLQWSTHLRNQQDMKEAGRVNPNRKSNGRFTTYSSMEK